jgi:hypothetical protein
MATLEELVVSLTAETSGLRAELSKAIKTTEDATAKMDDAIKEFSSNSNKNLTGFESAVATMAGVLGSEAVLGAFEKLKDAAGFLVDQFAHGVEAAAEEQDAMQKLANSIALTGNYSAAAMQQLADFADEIERTTGIDNSLVAANLAVLSSITKLNADGLQKAEAAAVDLSAALNMDLNSATNLIAKGIANSVDVFKRYGIQVEDGATKTERLANITKALASNQGAAVGATNTYNGAIKLLGVAYEDFLKMLGKWVTDNPVVIAMIKQTTTELQMLTGAADGATAPMQAVALTLITLANAMKLAVDFAGFLVDHLKILLAGFQAIDVVIAAVSDVIDGMVHGISRLGQGIYALVTGNEELANKLRNTSDELGNIKWEQTEQAFKALSETVNSESAFKDLSASLERIADSGADAFLKMDGAAKTATPSVKGAAAAVKELSESERLHQEAVKAFAETLISQANDINAVYAQEQADLQANLEMKLVTYEDYWSQRKEQLATQYTEEQAMLDEARAANRLSEEQHAIASQQLAINNYNLQKKYAQDKLEYDKKVNRATIQATGDLFGALSVLQESSSKELVAVGRAAATAQATINAYLAITNAMAQVPYPANIVAAAAIGISAFAQVAKINGIAFNKGTDSVPGTGTTDSVPAMLTPGERVVPQKTNQDLTEFLKGQEKGQQPMVNLTISFAGATIIGDLKSPEFGAVTVQAINEAIARGMALPILGT